MTHSSELISQANRKANDATNKDLPGASETDPGAVAKSPENDNAYVTLASIQLKNNQKAQAMATLKKAIELNPGEQASGTEEHEFQRRAERPGFQEVIWPVSKSRGA